MIGWSMYKQSKLFSSFMDCFTLQFRRFLIWSAPEKYNLKWSKLNQTPNILKKYVKNLKSWSLIRTILICTYQTLRSMQIYIIQENNFYRHFYYPYIGMHHEGVKFVQIRRNTTCSGINFCCLNFYDRVVHVQIKQIIFFIYGLFYSLIQTFFNLVCPRKVQLKMVQIKLNSKYFEKIRQKLEKLEFNSDNFNLYLLDIKEHVNLYYLRKQFLSAFLLSIY
eukprot:TRINITY_DN11110_c0_g1_i1.p1 TRINITY_DN11110_c0_g1~~TRINITY_DN11110_c0_g1_i1.p1  ORF type:complete len:221 (+),score=-5.27 TRINITY_DN11110_c0_g1_i1:108-770(+)